jgi:hypothetical protein
LELADAAEIAHEKQPVAAEQDFVGGRQDPPL